MIATKHIVFPVIRCIYIVRVLFNHIAGLYRHVHDMYMTKVKHNVKQPYTSLSETSSPLWMPRLPCVSKWYHYPLRKRWNFVRVGYWFICGCRWPNRAGSSAFRLWCLPRVPLPSPQALIRPKPLALPARYRYRSYRLLQWR